MNQTGKARIIVVDDHPQVGADLREMFEPNGYSVHCVTGDAHSIVANAIHDAQQVRPHVAVIDLRLRDGHLNEFSGLETLPQFHSAHCILYSAYLANDITNELKSHLYAWVGKHASPKLLRSTIHRAAMEKAAACHQIQVIWPDQFDPDELVKSTSDPALEPPSATILDDVVLQLHPERTKVRLKNLKRAEDSPSGVSRMRSAVFLSQADDLVTSVLKLARASQIDQEERNYKNYIEGRHVGIYGAQMVRKAKFWDIGGALYTFIGTKQQALSSFANFYRATPAPEQVVNVLSFFFTELWGDLYGEPRRLSTNSLFEAYDKVFDLRLEEQKLNDYFHQFLLPLDLPISLRNPVTWVFLNADLSRFARAREAITHGDLHGDNLFVDGGRTWVIDFERTGYGHILRDFVELEVDILTRLLAPEQVDDSMFLSLVQLLYPAPFEARDETNLASLTLGQEAEKALLVIEGLRQLARTVAGWEEVREYYWAVLLDALFVASIGKPQSHQQRRAMLLSIVVCDALH
jgi:DNA-binding NarL/FixJ family response regulator